MRFDTGQHMRMGQQMKLAPRMIQSMEILQMSQAALEERVEQELGSNPTLELVDAGADAAALQQEAKQRERDDRENERELNVTTNDERGGGEDFERLSNLSEQVGDSFFDNAFESGGDFALRRARALSGERDGKLDAMANTAARGASLYEQLMDQWRMAEVDAEVSAVGEHLIGLIDRDGYLRLDDEAMLADAPEGTTTSLLHDAVTELQDCLEPPGLAARDVRECILLQIDARERAEPDADREALNLQRRLVADHLKDLEANRYPKVSKALGMEIPEVQQAVLGLRRYTPYPGRLLAEDEVRVITPDAVIEYDEATDTYTATLTNGRIPALQISPGYEDMAKARDADAVTRQFIGTQLRNARWLLEAIEQRQTTLLRVIGVVVEAQREWFEQGDSALRPLPMTTVADQLGIHVATVSRAVNEKYLETPRGIVALRKFFSGGTETEEGESMSWTAVQAKLKDVIDAEDKAKPLSDDALVAEMKKQGIEIARRTVAKYRGQLGIPTARQRKQYT
ncbi:MAG: RNA polymerase factor sigma-54 [Planctomycetota bacterium]